MVNNRSRNEGRYRLSGYADPGRVQLSTPVGSGFFCEPDSPFKMGYHSKEQRVTCSAACGIAGQPPKRKEVKSTAVEATTSRDEGQAPGQLGRQEAATATHLTPTP